MTMRILADENIDRPIVSWLRAEGHDVVETSVVAMEAEDAELIAISRREQRILMTFDRDIGRLIQSDSLPHPGVVYLRLRGTGTHLWDAFARIWPQIQSQIAGHFVTVKNDQVRRRPLPIVPPR
jgi:predicted nuclease of predicted toxin-antitoxin system